ncbi:MAG: hypothetical protein DDT24_00440 [Chloroflexi bacterium]|nr:hypothetical protein [Chloroflexota bacterium]MBT9163531.1 hypothetical protein [Chloroflexota bacterium]MBT9165746.1 hypothetical protein [Chloroflexota bacterium]
MNRITAREKVVNDGAVETQFTGKNLTSVGRINLFLRGDSGFFDDKFLNNLERRSKR